MRATAAWLAIVLVCVGCVPAPARIVVIGDSHSTPTDSWPSALDCAPVANRSIGGAGLGRTTWIPPVTARLDDVLAGVGDGDLVVMAVGSNDFGHRTVAQMKVDKATVDRAITDRGAQVRWVTSPPFSPRHPYWWLRPWFTDAKTGRASWNAHVIATGGIDIYAPLGSTLDTAEDSGDHVHLSPSAHYVAAVTAQEALCPQP